MWLGKGTTNIMDIEEKKIQTILTLHFLFTSLTVHACLLSVDFEEGTVGWSRKLFSTCRTCGANRCQNRVECIRSTVFNQEFLQTFRELNPKKPLVIYTDWDALEQVLIRRRR